MLDLRADFVVYALVCLIPSHAELILSVFAALVMITVGQRVVPARQTLR